MGQLIYEMKDAKDIFKENIEKLFDRDEKLTIVAMKYNDLNQKVINVHYHVLMIFI